MDAVFFLQQMQRMCRTISTSNNGECKNCPLEKICLDGSILSFALADHVEVVAIIEKWATEHPAKTKQSELMKLFPDVDCDDDAIVAICPKYFGFKPECDEYGSCVGDCCGCRRKFWLAEIEEEE